MSRPKKTKVKYKRTSKAVEKLVYGDEPEWTDEKLEISELKLKISKSCKWYSYFVDNKTKKEWFLEFLKTNNYTKIQLNIFKRIPDNFFCALGAFSRMKSLGVVFPEVIEKSFNKKINDLYNHQYPVSHKPTTSTTIKPPKIQEHITRKIDDFCGIFEEQIDNFINNSYSTNYDIVSNLVQQNIKKKQISSIIEYINDYHLKELKELYEGKNKELNESYKISRRNLKKIINFLETSIEKCHKYSDKITPTGKIRTKKIKTSEQIVAGLKYLEKNEQLKISSIPPKKIIKSTELWVYDTIARRIKCYNSNTGLSVVGTTIIGFSGKSYMKTLRKPEEFFKQLGSGGKRTIKQLFNGIKGKKLPLTSGRMNSKIIILRAF